MAVFLSSGNSIKEIKFNSIAKLCAYETQTQQFCILIQISSGWVGAQAIYILFQIQVRLILVFVQLIWIKYSSEMLEIC